MRGEHIRKNFIKIEQDEACTHVYVLEGHWGRLPHQIDFSWTLVKSLPRHPDSYLSLELESPFGISKGHPNYTIEREIEKILDSKKYFRTCDDCGIRVPRYLISTRICDKCMFNRGVIY